VILHFIKVFYLIFLEALYFANVSFGCVQIIEVRKDGFSLSLYRGFVVVENRELNVKKYFNIKMINIAKGSLKLQFFFWISANPKAN